MSTNFRIAITPKRKKYLIKLNDTFNVSKVGDDDLSWIDILLKQEYYSEADIPHLNSMVERYNDDLNK